MPPELLERERTGSVQIIEDDIDLGESRKKTEKRNFDKVNFGQWQIKTWYIISFIYEFIYLDTWPQGITRHIRC